jgi:YVTN family beta-propeller protein
MKTKYLLYKRFSGTRVVSGMLVSLLALSLTVVSAAVAAPFAYVSKFTMPGTVSVIDQATNTVVASITVGNLPGGVAVNPAGTRAYVANKDDGTVSVIDVASNTVVATVRVGPEPWGVAVSDDGSRVYVANGGNGTVSLIAANNLTATPTTIPTTGGLLNGVVVVGSRAYVSDASTGSVIVIDGTAQVGAVEVGTPLNSQPMGIVANRAGTRVYVVDLIDDFRGRILEVSAIDTATNTVVVGETLALEEDTSAAPSGLAISPDDSRLYVVNDDRNWVTVITLASRTFQNVSVGMAPFGVALDRAGTRVYVGNAGGQSVSVIDAATNTVLTTVGVGNAPFAFGAFVTSAPTQFELILTTAGAGSISTDQALVAAAGVSGTGMYDAGTVVNLTATPAAGSQFSGWSEDCSGTGPCQVRMDGPRRVTANFTVIPPPPPTDPAPTTCDEKIKDLQKKVAGHKRPWWHHYDLKLALRMYSETLAKLGKAKAKVGDHDKRFVHAQKEFDSGKTALCAGRYWLADREFWHAYEIALRILRHSHYRR